MDGQVGGGSRGWGPPPEFPNLDLDPEFPNLDLDPEFPNLDLDLDLDSEIQELIYRLILIVERKSLYVRDQRASAIQISLHLSKLGKYWAS